MTFLGDDICRKYKCTEYGCAEAYKNRSIWSDSIDEHCRTFCATKTSMCTWYNQTRGGYSYNYRYCSCKNEGEFLCNLIYCFYICILKVTWRYLWYFETIFLILGSDDVPLNGAQCCKSMKVPRLCLGMCMPAPKLRGRKRKKVKCSSHLEAMKTCRFRK